MGRLPHPLGGQRGEHPDADRTHRQRRVARRERGTALISTIGGVTVFLVLLTFAVQVALHLYATSVVTSAAYDAARLVATGDDRATAEAHARSLMGDVGRDAVFEWNAGTDAVRLRVVVEPPHLLPPVAMIDRTVTVRLEVPRPDA